MIDENNQIKFFLYENWARTKTGQRTVQHIFTSYLAREKVNLQNKLPFFKSSFVDNDDFC